VEGETAFRTRFDGRANVVVPCAASYQFRSREYKAILICDALLALGIKSSREEGADSSRGAPDLSEQAANAIPCDNAGLTTSRRDKAEGEGLLPLPCFLVVFGIRPNQTMLFEDRRSVLVHCLDADAGRVIRLLIVNCVENFPHD